MKYKYNKATNRATAVMEKPPQDYPRGDNAVWEHDKVLEMKAAIREYNNRPSYPCAPGEWIDGREYDESEINIIKQFTHTSGWIEVATLIITPKDNDMNSGSIKNKKVLVAEEIPEFKKHIDSMPLEDKIYVDKSIAIADKIIKRIEELGLTQKELADKMGKTEAEISRGLAGEQNFTLRSICKFEAALNFKIIEI